MNICMRRIVLFQIKNYLFILKILFPVSFIADTSSYSVPPQAIPPKLPRSARRTVELEQLIAKERSSSKMNLERRKLTDEDMEVIASSALNSNKVSNIKYYVIELNWLSNSNWIPRNCLDFQKLY